MAGISIPASGADPDFAAWLTALRAEAIEQGISPTTLDDALQGIEPLADVIERDRRQPEFTQTFWNYLDRRVTPTRIERGRMLLAQNEELLAEVQRRYGVQPRFLVAFWGLESNFGDYTGNFPVIGAVATLAYDERRSAFFRAQLLDALRILEEGHITPAAMTGSWAGAMGQLQFIPSTFVHYAVDHDGDGRRDIWQSLPDIFASAANYLANIGWDGSKTWGREVRLPPDFAWNLAGMDEQKDLADWQALGVRRADGRNLPQVDIAGSIVLPAGHRGPAFLVYRNFHAILGWNRSLFYAIAVGHLADRIAGNPAFASARPAEERPLSRREVEELQELLLSLGFDPGTPDGVIGSQTRAALRAFQRTAGLPPDGYPSYEALQLLRQSSKS
ncbi:MAG: lytic murein transglycosylase [Kiloniellales bacterium]|jgi:membrane-bound lytic murein transglycosylase B